MCPACPPSSLIFSRSCLDSWRSRLSFTPVSSSNAERLRLRNKWIHKEMNRLDSLKAKSPKVRHQLVHFYTVCRRAEGPTKHRFQLQTEGECVLYYRGCEWVFQVNYTLKHTSTHWPWSVGARKPLTFPPNVWVDSAKDVLEDSSPLIPRDLSTRTSCRDLLTVTSVKGRRPRHSSGRLTVKAALLKRLLKALVRAEGTRERDKVLRRGRGHRCPDCSESTHTITVPLMSGVYGVYQ